MNNRTIKTGDSPDNPKSGATNAIPIHESKLRKIRSAKAVSNTDTEYSLEDLAQMTARIAQLPDIDAARIVELHDRIISGEYQVDSHSLASKLQKFESDL